ncbi:hypothetical protein XENOCAPTIV_027142 [Xenoophorus captivus]|uniref:Uncharacterized protein n=1 Tax=Xenoophorus captivus TaxID=1517983 RepID=A0ABV0SBP2_9TELE
MTPNPLALTVFSCLVVDSATKSRTTRQTVGLAISGFSSHPPKTRLRKNRCAQLRTAQAYGMFFCFSREKCKQGLDVLTKINESFVDKDFVPFQDIRINHTVVLDDPFDDPPDLPVPDRSPEPTKEQLDVRTAVLFVMAVMKRLRGPQTNLNDYKYYNWEPQLFSMYMQSGRIGADEVIDDADGKGAEELEERLKEKEAKTQAILLEMVRQRSALCPLLNILKIQPESVLTFPAGW